MTQCIVVDVTNGLIWVDRDTPSRGYPEGIKIPLASRPAFIYESLCIAEKEAGRLSCETDGEFAVFELVSIAHAKELLDTEAVRGMGPCGARVPKWLEGAKI